MCRISSLLQWWYYYEEFRVMYCLKWSRHDVWILIYMYVKLYNSCERKAIINVYRMLTWWIWHKIWIHVQNIKQRHQKKGSACLNRTKQSKIVFFCLFCQKLVSFNVVLLTITHFSTITGKIIREVLACSLKCMQNYANVYSEKHKYS